MGDVPAPAAFPFDRKEGAKLVHGGFVVAFIALLIFLLKGYAWLVPVAAGGLLVSLRFAPMVDRRRPQLLLLGDGLVVDGLGLLPWADIKAVTRHETYVRTIPQAELLLETTRPVKTAVRPQRSLSPLRRVQTMIWSLPGETLLRLKVGALAGGADAIEAAIRERLRA